MSDSDDIERVIVEIKNLKNNSRELIYKQLRKKINEKITKLEEIKKKLDNGKIKSINNQLDKFIAPLKKRKRYNDSKSSDSFSNSIDSMSFGEYNSLNLQIPNNEEEYDPNYPNDYEMVFFEIVKIL